MWLLYVSTAWWDNLSYIFGNNIDYFISTTEWLQNHSITLRMLYMSFFSWALADQEQ